MEARTDSKTLSAIERELGVARCFAACRGDDDKLNEADAELHQLRRIQHAAELACGLLWHLSRNHPITEAAFKVLCNALGGPGSAGLAHAIRAAKDYGAKALASCDAGWALAGPRREEFWTPVAKVHVHRTGGNAGLTWSAVSLEDGVSPVYLRDGEVLYVREVA